VPGQPGEAWRSGTRGLALSGDAGRALDSAADLANLALASEQLGAMGACLAMTAGYAKIRVAFGQPRRWRG
jgi:alkylation response protein AidB-like acyl-CoA dehydrogenase